MRRLVVWETPDLRDLVEATMEADDFGIEQITEEDRRYRGSRFSEVRAAIFANPYQNLWGCEGILPLPRYETTVSSVFALSVS